ncbi:MAG: TolC family protein [Gemmatimonadota bacterium]|nr:TolC family protein [Gemmatimonadota bacterium]
MHHPWFRGRRDRSRGRYLRLPPAPALAVGWIICAVVGTIVPLAAQQRDSASRRDSSRAARDSAILQREANRIRKEPRGRIDTRALTSPTAVSPGQPLRLTRQEAIREALAHNPTIQVAREQIAQAEARVTQGYALPEPAIGVSVLGQSGVLRPHSATETDLTFGITVPFPDKIRLRGQVARGDLGNIDQLYALQRQLVVLQTNKAYDSLLVSLRHREDLEEARRLNEDFLLKTRARFNAGTAAKLDVIKAQVAVAQSENDLIANTRGIANARAGLNRLLGRLLGASVEAADTLGIPDSPPDFEQLERLAMARRPELLGLAAQRAGALAARRLAQQYFLPDVSVSVSRNTVYGNDAVYSTGVGIGLPLFPWQHQRGEVAETRHRDLELAAQFRDLSAQVGEDLRNAYATATTSLRQAIYIRDQLLPAAREQYRVASVSYGLGGSSALEVIDAQRTLLDAQTQYAAALAAANDAMADLERATGASFATDLNGATNVR